jgi:DNA polymerase-1
MVAAARVESVGVPIDTGTLGRLRRDWDGLRLRLVTEVDADYGVYEGTSFRASRWEAYLASRSIPWPRLASGALALDDDTFRAMARAHPAEVGPIRDLRHTVGQLRLNDLAVGPDGRNRTPLSAFQSKTGRNQPSNSRFIFGPSCWLRSLIRPESGTALAYLDWSGQEYGIAAALSGDATMLGDYASGDPYLAFARRARAVPHDATKQTHPRERELFKTCCGLGAMYGAGPETLSGRLGVSVYQAREWLRMHRAVYREYWAWSESAVNNALLTGKLSTVFGWTVRLDANANARSLSNFPMQANGAEMLRLACCLATEGGIRVCAPVHDALLIEAPLATIVEAVAATAAAMSEASRAVLDGFVLRTDAKIVAHPERYGDPRGERMWQLVTSMLTE